MVSTLLSRSLVQVVCFSTIFAVCSYLSGESFACRGAFNDAGGFLKSFPLLFDRNRVFLPVPLTFTFSAFRSAVFGFLRDRLYGRPLMRKVLYTFAWWKKETLFRLKRLVVSEVWEQSFSSLYAFWCFSTFEAWRGVSARCAVRFGHLQCDERKFEVSLINISSVGIHKTAKSVFMSSWKTPVFAPTISLFANGFFFLKYLH